MFENAAKNTAEHTAFIFDMDGTIVDSIDSHALAWQEALDQFAFHYPLRRIRCEIGRCGDRVLEALLSVKDEKKFGGQIESLRSEIFRRSFLPQIKPFPRVRELFQEIHSQGNRIILTGPAKKNIISVYKEIAGVTPYVTAEVTGNGLNSKGDAEIYQTASRMARQSHAKKTIAIGDSPYDALIAGKAGLFTIGLCCSGFSADELWSAGCAKLFDNPAALWLYLSTERAASGPSDAPSAAAFFNAQPFGSDL